MVAFFEEEEEADRVNSGFFVLWDKVIVKNQ